MSLLPPEYSGQNETAPSTVLSSDPRKALKEVMSTIDQLRGVYIRETEALEKADTQSFFTLQDEKLSVARLYQKSIQELLIRKEELKSTPLDMRQKLEAMQKDFSALTKNNMEALSRMQRSVDRLGNTLRNAAKDTAKKERVFSYGETGRVDHDDKKPLSTGISETA